MATAKTARRTEAGAQGRMTDGSILKTQRKRVCWESPGEDSRAREEQHAVRLSSRRAPDADAGQRSALGIGTRRAARPRVARDADTVT